MEDYNILYSLFLIFVGAALFATLALYARQSLIVGYMMLGVMLGPPALGWVSDTELISDIAEMGIIFLLFLLGLNLSPQKLLHLLRQTTIVAVSTSLVFALLGSGVAFLAGFKLMEVIVAGVACMFSSTIIGLKLLPTTVLHHRHTGEVIVSILLLQDLIAIAVLLGLQAMSGDNITPLGMIKVVISLPVVIVVAWGAKKYFLMPLITRFNRIQEYIFLVALAWCIGIAQATHSLGFSYEMGAFVAGITIATSPIALFIVESLKPLRDFFLILFFFTLGAALELEELADLWLPAVVLGLTMLIVKPPLFRYALRRVSETDKLGWETGFRLGQMSEFSLLVVYMALQSQLISTATVYFVQLATIITFIGSSYLVVLRYPTPMAISDRLRRD